MHISPAIVEGRIASPTTKRMKNSEMIGEMKIRLPTREVFSA